MPVKENGGSPKNMSISFDSAGKTLSLHTRNSSYQMQIGPLGYLLHNYYGRRAEGDFGALHLPKDVGFSPNPHALGEQRGWSLDTMPQEYSGANAGDFRLSSVCASAENGARGADLHYVRHAISRGKYALTGLPAAFAAGDEAETLSVTLADPALGLEAELLYAVYEQSDIITRAVRLKNVGSGPLRLEKAASACLDLPFGDWELLHFPGRYAMERQTERVPVLSGTQRIGSGRVASSHQQNPFAILCDPHTTQDNGDCCGLMPVYSGSWETEIERDQMGSVRVVSGIRAEGFSWLLEPGASFDTPELLLCFRHDGLNALSQCFHRFLREKLCRSRYSRSRRPVLLNNWEATYFNFDAERILSIAREAKELGADLFVLDDGWFGKRSDDRSSLGDWFVNEEKLPGGLEPLIAGIKDLGLGFGLWIEPEMISEDSQLYRAHPDWALAVPGRQPSLSRSQLALDLSRGEVTDWLYETVAGLLRRYDIDYIKWDINRSLTDLYSPALPPERQGELAHRCTLGLYSVLERLTAAFPNVLFEGCAGGGGRFDAGILAYFPQIWCSDNTDPVERLQIQRGSSYGYPLSAMGAHVSASPNHQTGRRTPLDTRAVVAMAGGFGYELDPGKLSAEEKTRIRAQIARFRSLEELLREGDYFRLGEEEDAGDYAAWQTVSPDREKSLLSLVLTHPRANPRPLHLRLRGLDPETCYRLEQVEIFDAAMSEPYAAQGRICTGAALLYGGLTLPRLYGDCPSVQVLLQKVQPQKEEA